MPISQAGEQINEALLAWPGVTAHPHRFGGTEYRLGRRELGHVHGNSLADLPFPTRVRDQIIAAGLAEPHHVLPDSGWVSFFIRTDGDIQSAIELFRRSYDLATASAKRRTQESGSVRH